MEVIWYLEKTKTENEVLKKELDLAKLDNERLRCEQEGMIDSLNDLNDIINDFILSNIEEFIKLADMLNNWKAEIVNSFAKVNGTRVSNGPIEGRNSLIKKILKIANGYSNFKRFRNRVIYCLNTLAKHNFISQ